MKGPWRNPDLLKVPLYIAGKSPQEVLQEYGLSEALKLASNESPLGPSPRALQALQEASAEAHRYPGSADSKLCERLAAFHNAGLGADHFLIGNGATDILRMIAQAFVSPGGETIMADVTFPMYDLLTLMFSGRSFKVELTPEYDFDLEAMADAVTDQTRIIWLCSPNNPTGLVLLEADMERFLDRIPDHVVVVIDESYIDFVAEAEVFESLDSILKEFNLLSVRSFSKSAGLANLRVGYVAGRLELIHYLKHAQLPFNTGAPAIAAAMASLEDEDYRARSREIVLQERAFLFQRLTGLGLKCLPSEANFLVLLDVPGGGKAFAENLLKRGIIVRPMDAFGLPDSIRISLGKREKNERLLDEVEGVLKEATLQGT